MIRQRSKQLEIWIHREKHHGSCIFWSLVLYNYNSVIIVYSVVKNGYSKSLTLLCTYFLQKHKMDRQWNRLSSHQLIYVMKQESTEYTWEIKSTDTNSNLKDLTKWTIIFSLHESILFENEFLFTVGFSSADAAAVTAPPALPPPSLSSSFTPSPSALRPTSYTNGKVNAC